MNATPETSGVHKAAKQHRFRLANIDSADACGQQGHNKRKASVSLLRTGRPASFA